MSSGLPKSGERPFSFLTHTGVISTKKKIIALGIVNLVMLPLTITVACDPDTPESAFTPEEPVPEDPALYAPDSWPLEVGDTVMSEDWGDLVDQFVRPCSSTDAQFAWSMAWPTRRTSGQWTWSHPVRTP